MTFLRTSTVRFLSAGAARQTSGTTATAASSATTVSRNQRWHRENQAYAQDHARLVGRRSAAVAQAASRDEALHNANQVLESRISDADGSQEFRSPATPSEEEAVRAAVDVHRVRRRVVRVRQSKTAETQTEQAKVRLQNAAREAGWKDAQTAAAVAAAAGNASSTLEIPSAEAAMTNAGKVAVFDVVRTSRDGKRREQTQETLTPKNPFHLEQFKRLFRVRRTKNGSGDLPVYSVYRRGGLEVNTIVRNLEGDVSALIQELRTVCEAPVRARVGSLEIRGLHVWKVKEWLISCGF